MPITSKTDWSSNLTTFIVNGEISANENLSVFKAFYENPDHPPTLNILWDLRDIIPSASITDEDIHRVVTYLSKHESKRVGGKTAVVARADFEYNFGKKYELFTKLNAQSVTVEVFRSLGEAMIWLGAS